MCVKIFAHTKIPLQLQLLVALYVNRDTPTMSKNLYFKTDNFKSNEDIASFFFDQLSAKGLVLEKPIDAGFMCSIVTKIDDEKVVFYMGKNDEPSTPPLWQVWPEQKASIFKEIFGKVDRTPENKAKSLLEEIVQGADGVTDIEWAI